jgi:hypothetical protein
MTDKYKDPHEDHKNLTLNPRYLLMVIATTFLVGLGLFAYFMPIDTVTSLLGENGELAKLYAPYLIAAGLIVAAINILITFTGRDSADSS